MIAIFAIVSGCLGIRLRTHCRIRHKHKCDSIYNLRLRKFAPPARAKYTEYKSLICAMGVFRSHTPRACKCSPLLPLHPSSAFSLTAIYRSVPRSRYTHLRRKFTIESSGAFPPFPDTPALLFLFLPRLVRFYILHINPALP